MQKGKWLSEEALQIAEKRREAKGKREKETYTHLNAEFQRTARRDKKAFLCDEYKEIDETPPSSQDEGLFSCMARKTIPSHLSNLHRRLHSLYATQWAPRDPRRDSRGERY